MKKIIRRVITIGGILIVLLTLTPGPVSACTGFTVSEGNKVLVGNNEDYHDPDCYIRFIPSQEEKYGCMFIELKWPLEIIAPNWYAPFCGMNDQGLSYDSYATPSLKPVNSTDKPTYFNQADYYKYSLPAYCLSICATIEEVLQIYDKYTLEFMEYEQHFWVDRTGASVIIEGDDIIYKEGKYQVVTNYLQSHPGLGGYPCRRYETAVSMLENMTGLSVEYFRDICNATHQEGYSDTEYSYVYDSNENMMYLYHYYDYGNLVVVDIEAEFAKGEHSYYLPSLFEPTDNQAPNKPNKPSGPASGKVKEECTYSASGSKDPNGDKVFYLFDWGDGTDSGWIKPTLGAKATHEWKKQGTYEIKVKAKDIYGKESDWSDPLPVSMPKNKMISINPLIIQFLENHPHLFPLLRQLLLFLG